MKQTLTKILALRPVRQIGGALAGALLALLVYTTYQTGAGLVKAYLLPPGISTVSEVPSGTNVDPEKDADKAQRMAARAERAVATMRKVQRARTTVPPEATADVAPGSFPEPAAHQAAPDLTDSGAGLWIAGLLALICACAAFPRTRKLFAAALEKVH